MAYSSSVIERQAQQLGFYVKGRVTRILSALWIKVFDFLPHKHHTTTKNISFSNSVSCSYMIFMPFVPLVCCYVQLCCGHYRARQWLHQNEVVRTFIHSFIHQYSALGAGLEGARAQSCDRYGSGTLHPGQVLGGSLPLLSPAFRRSYFHRQVPVRPQRRERS